MTIRSVLDIAHHAYHASYEGIGSGFYLSPSQHYYIRDILNVHNQRVWLRKVTLRLIYKGYTNRSRVIVCGIAEIPFANHFSEEALEGKCYLPAFPVTEHKFKTIVNHTAEDVVITIQPSVFITMANEMLHKYFKCNSVSWYYYINGYKDAHYDGIGKYAD